MGITISINDDAGSRCITLEKPIVVLGRSRSCDVVLSSRVVSSTHAKLRIYRDHAVLEDLGSTNGIFVDGVRVGEQTNVARHSRIEFGPDGPMVEIINGLEPSTQLHEAGESDAAATSRGWSLALFGGVAVLLLVMIPVLFLGGLAAILMLFGSAPAKIDQQAIFSKYGNSVYLVCARSPGVPVIPVGTAFPIDSHGLFATNAHVVIGIATLLKKIPDLEFYVVSPGGRVEYKLKDWLAHREYVEGDKYTPDVGVLHADVPENARLLAVPLATDSELRQIEMGSELCYVGYPSLDKDDFVQLKQIVPRAFRGNVVRLMNLHKEEADFEHAVLLEHNMHSSGGASGSPIFGTCGKVVALHFAGTGNIDAGTGIVRHVEAGIKWGMRADLLRDVLADFERKRDLRRSPDRSR
jgi:pSer/pThr/pTyr-binding forkhead associated (FHA) protein